MLLRFTNTAAVSIPHIWKVCNNHIKRLNYFFARSHVRAISSYLRTESEYFRTLLLWLQWCRASVPSLPALGPWASPAERGPLLESIYRVSLTHSWSLRRFRQKISSIYCTVICKLTRYALVFVRSCSSINNKIISLKKFISPQPVGAPQKEKKSGGPGHVPSVPIG